LKRKTYWKDSFPPETEGGGYGKSLGDKFLRHYSQLGTLTKGTFFYDKLSQKVNLIINMQIKEKIKLASYTSFKTGGVAQYFCEVKKLRELKECINWSKENNIKYHILGNGSNILVNDIGVDGLVIKISNKNIKWLTSGCLVESGVILNNLITLASKRNLGGLEWAFGIPCTVGGAVRNNAGAFGKSIKDSIKKIAFFDTKKNKIEIYKPKNTDFGYHETVFKKHPNWIVWEVELKMNRKDKKNIKKELDEVTKKRKDKQPLEYPSVGSFFKNPLVKNITDRKGLKLAEEFAKSIGEKKVEKIPAGFIIEKAKLKGRKIGGVEISKKHGNFLINTGNAKSEDAIILASIIKQKVRNLFGIQLQEEVEYLGF